MTRRVTTKGVLLMSLALAIVRTLESTPSLKHAEVGLGLHRLDNLSLSQLRDLGIRRARYTLYWSQWHNPAYREEWEREVNQALDAGLDLLIVVHQAPFGDFQKRRFVYAEFARFMEARAAQFSRVGTWQLWNEMDVAFTDVFGAGHPAISLRQRGRYYAEMLRVTYPAIKRGNPRALVVVGGIASDINGGFLQGLYDNQAQYDVLAIHTYGFPLMLPFKARGKAARRIMKAHHDNRPLWNTEFGLERAVIPRHQALTEAQTDSIQLAAWQTVLEANARDRVYERTYGYVLAEREDLGFALVRLDGTTRPAYRWLRSWTQQR